MLKWLSDFIPAKADHFGIRLFRFAIERNHLHLLIQATDRRGLNGFLRVVTGVIARKALDAEKGKSKNQQMWEKRPYSRVLSWRREFENVLNYIERNVLEAKGCIPYIDRGKKLTIEMKEHIAFSLTPQLTMRV